MPGEGKSISRNYTSEGKRAELFLGILKQLRGLGKSIKANR